MVVYLPSLSVLNLISIFNNCCMSTGQVVRFPDPVDIFNANPAYRTPRKGSHWELIALLTSPLPYYTLVVKKWVLLLSTVFGFERDARFFFIMKIFPVSYRLSLYCCKKHGGGNSYLEFVKQDVYSRKRSNHRPGMAIPHMIETRKETRKRVRADD